MSNDIALHEKWEDVVSDAKHVHFLHALDHTSLSAQYFSLLPSNNTRNVLSKWHNAATHAKTEDGQDVASLNSIRTCKAGDVICQPRALTRFTCSPARMRCDAVWGVVMIRVYAVVLTFIICISYMSTLRRRFSFMRVPNGNALLLCLCFLLAICMGRWTQIVSNICTVIGVHKRHTFTKDISVGDTYFSSPDLTGTWDKFAYVYADGVERIRISGPGVSLVVICVKVVLFVGRGLGDGYMVRCLFWGCVVRMVVSIVGRLNAFGEREEYVEVGAGRKESKGRSFGLPRDRARVQRQV